MLQGVMDSTVDVRVAKNTTEFSTNTLYALGFLALGIFPLISQVVFWINKINWTSVQVFTYSRSEKLEGEYSVMKWEVSLCQI